MIGIEIYVDEIFFYLFDEDEVWLNVLMLIEYKKNKRFLIEFFVRIFNYYYCNMNLDLLGYIRCV